mgnify:CR=1 FL=1
MINILNLFTIPENVAWWILWSAVLGVIVFIYWFLSFNDKKVVHIVKKKKLNIWLLFREYHFYVLFVILTLITGLVFIESINYSIALIVAMLLWVYLYLFTGKSEVYNWWDDVEVGDIKIVNEKDADEVWGIEGKQKEKEDEWDKAENAGTLKESMVKNLVIGLFWLVAITILSIAIVHFNLTTEAEYLMKEGSSYVSTKSTFATYAIVWPLVYSILFWVSFTDRQWLVIMDRFMYALIFVGLWAFIYTYPLWLEDMTILLFFFSFFLIFMAWLERIGIMPPIGYQDIPLMFAFWLLFQYWALVFIVTMLCVDILEGIYRRARYGKQKLIKIWMYRYAFFVLILTYIWMLLFNL